MRVTSRPACRPAAVAAYTETAAARRTGKKADRVEGCRLLSLSSAAAAAARSSLSFAMSVSRADAW